MLQEYLLVGDFSKGFFGNTALISHLCASLDLSYYRLCSDLSWSPKI